MPHPLQNNPTLQALNQVLEGFFFFANFRFLCRRTSLKDFVVIDFPFVSVFFSSSLPEICSTGTSVMS